MADDCSNEKDFCIEKAKTGRAACRRCKQKCETGVLRIAKLVPNHFSDGGGKLKQWYHVDCLFEMFKTQKATTKRIESFDDMEGWDALGESERDYILEKFEGSLSASPKKGKAYEFLLIRKGQGQRVAKTPPTSPELSYIKHRPLLSSLKSLFLRQMAQPDLHGHHSPSPRASSDAHQTVLYNGLPIIFRAPTPNLGARNRS